MKMKQGTRQYVRLMRSLPSDVNLLSRPPLIGPLLRSTTVNLVVSAGLLLASLWLLTFAEVPRSSCGAASTANALGWIIASFVAALLFHALNIALRRHGLLRWTRDMMFTSGGMLLFAVVRTVICW